MDIEKIKTAFDDERGEIKDVLERVDIDCVTLITSKKGAVRGNHYHKESEQYVFLLSGKMRFLTQMPGKELEEAITVSGDLVFTPPFERHTMIAIEDSTFIVFTRGPRGGKDYEKDTYRLSIPLSPGV